MTVLTEIIDSFVESGVYRKVACDGVAKAFIAGHLATAYRNEPKMLVGLDYEIRAVDVASKTATDIAGKSFR